MANTGPQQPSPPNKANSPWGIYDSAGDPVFDVDSFLALEDDERSKVSDFPVESGSFASYNKVQQPFELKIKMVVGGNATRMTAFLNKLYEAKESTDLYIVATPEFTFQDATLVSFNYKREASKGADMISAECVLKEIRQVSAAYTNVKLPPAKVKKAAAGDKKNSGKQQPRLPDDWDKTKGKSVEDSIAMGLDNAAKHLGGK